MTSRVYLDPATEQQIAGGRRSEEKIYSAEDKEKILDCVEEKLSFEHNEWDLISNPFIDQTLTLEHPQRDMDSLCNELDSLPYEQKRELLRVRLMFAVQII